VARGRGRGSAGLRDPRVNWGTAGRGRDFMPIPEWKTLRSSILKILSAAGSIAKQVAGSGSPELEKCGASTIRHRLEEGKTCLEYLDAERECRSDPSFGRVIEEQVVWGELLELELQDVDEQLSRICDAAGGATDQNPRGSKASNANPRKRRFP
jgi:hypothetical protein